MNLLFCPDSVPNLIGLFDTQIAPPLLFYSYIPIAALALFLGLFVFIRHKSIETRILFYLSLVFVLWVLNVLVQWVAVHANVVHFSWQISALIEIFIPLLAVYFTYSFLYQKSSTVIEVVLALCVLATAVLTPTSLNIGSFDLANCEANVGILLPAVYGIEFFSFLFIVFLAIKKSFTIGERSSRLHTLAITAGVSFFLITFALSNILGELTQTYEINLIGPVGMVVFLFFLSYAIVRFKVFNLKILGTQVLVALIWILVVSLLLLNNLYIIHWIVGATAAILLPVGILLVRSVKRVDEQAEILAITNTRLQEEEQFQSELLSVAAHQLKGPLANVVGYNQTVLDGDTGEANEETKQAVHISLTTATSALTIVDQFLSVGRIKRGAMHYDMQDCDVRKLLEQVIFELKLMIEKKGLAYELSIPEDQNFMMVGDQSRIKQTIYVLIDNAIKYTPQGSLAIALAREGDIIRFSVKDTGVGISAEDRKKLFTKFGRGPESHTVNASSSGLGLYLAKEFVLAHKGRIWVDSEGRGKGSQFIFEVPTTLRKSNTLNGKPDPFVGPRASVRG